MRVKEMKMNEQPFVVRGINATRTAILRMMAWFFRRRLVLGILSLAWLLYRSGLRPHRMAYPCQQAAAANVAGVVGGTALAGFLLHRFRRRLLRREMAVACVALIVFGIIGVKGYAIIADVFQIRASAVIPQAHLADQPVYPSAGLTAFPDAATGGDAVVAVKRNTAITYGATQPYDKASNPAYQFVWDTVAQLRLGPADDPLRDLVRPGNTVLIKPNVAGVDCTQSAAVRPVVDMCLQAGAARVNIGDCGPCGYTQGNLDGLGLTAMAQTLRSRGKPVYTLAFAVDSPWSWVNLGPDSAYSGSGYTQANLQSSQYSATYFSQTDSHGVNPHGQVMGWHAMPDYIFSADVVINMPKLKVHDALVGTFVVKNWVGAGLFSTVSSNPSCDINFARVCHWAAVASTNYDYSYGNDFMWRDLADMHRATMYWKNGQLQSAPQRKYLAVVDAITAVDHRQNVGGGGTPVQLGAVLASVDPIACEAVTHRAVRWDFRLLPNANNAPSVPSHPWGTNDPARIRVIGDAIGPAFNALFTSDNFTGYAEHTAMKINDLAPPGIVSVGESRVGSRLTIEVQTDADAAAVFLYYGDDGTGNPRVARMARNGSAFSMQMLAATMTYRVVAQDRFFNWISSDQRQFTFVQQPDVNGDGRVNILDLITVRNSLNKDPMSDDAAAISDVNADGRVNILDLITVRNSL